MYINLGISTQFCDICTFSWSGSFWHPHLMSWMIAIKSRSPSVMTGFQTSLTSCQPYFVGSNSSRCGIMAILHTKAYRCACRKAFKMPFLLVEDPLFEHVCTWTSIILDHPLRITLCDSSTACIQSVQKIWSTVHLALPQNQVWCQYVHRLITDSGACCKAK